MVDLPKRNPIRGGPPYRPPGDSFVGAATTAAGDLARGAASVVRRVVGAWQAAGPKPAAPSAPSGAAAPTPEMIKARKSIADIESRGSGGYDAIGPKTKSGDRAWGKYQVMGANIPKWTSEITGREHTPQEFQKDPELQDKVFDKQFGDAAKKYGSHEAASKWWFTGKPPNKITGKEKDVVGTTASQYGAKFTAGFGEEKEMKELDEFKSPWAGIDKAAADTARWRKNREEGKQAVTDAKTERKPSWIKGVVKDYISAKYGVKKEEKLDEIYPPMWAGYPAHMEKLRKEHEAKKKADKEKKESEKKEVKEGAISNKIADVMDKHKLWGKVPFTKKFEYDDYEPKKKPHTSTIKGKKYVVKEDKTQISPGVASEEHPKKFELPEKYEGSYSVRKIYVDEGSGSFYGGGGAGGYNVASSPARQVPRPAARPQVARPQAATAPVAKPAAAPTAPPTSTPAAAPTQPSGQTLSTPGPVGASKPTGTPGYNTQAAPTPTPTFKAPEPFVASTVADTFAKAQPITGGGGAPVPKPTTSPAPTTAAPPLPDLQKPELAAPVARNISAPTPTLPKPPAAPAAAPEPEAAAEPSGPFSKPALPGQGPLQGMIKKKISGFLGGLGG